MSKRRGKATWGGKVGTARWSIEKPSPEQLDRMVRWHEEASPSRTELVSMEYRLEFRDESGVGRIEADSWGIYWNDDNELRGEDEGWVGMNWERFDRKREKSFGGLF